MLPARARRSVPLGIGVLTSRGVTAWQRALATAASALPARPAAAAGPALAELPLLAAELIGVLANLALGGP